MKYSILLPLLLCSMFAFSQEDYHAIGVQAYQKKDYATAEANLKKALEKNSKDNMAMVYLGSSQIELNKTSDAIQTLNAAYTEVPRGLKNEVDYLLAKAYYLSGDKTNGNDMFKRLVADGGGFGYYRRIQNDAKLKDVVAISETDPVAEGLKKNSFPCMYDPNFRQLDFFIGMWDVYLKTGPNADYTQKVATDSVVQSEGACSLIEYFEMTVPPNNFHGRSFSFYDGTAKIFRHNWAGQGGDVWNYELVKRDGNFTQLIAKAVERNGGTRIRRFSMTYDPEAQTIHQFIENSFDEGKTWQPDWDAMFKKRK